MQQPKQSWQKLSKKTVYDNLWIHVEEHDVINPSGNKSIYGVVQFKNYAIGILPIDADGNIYLVGQHRYPFNDYSWEIPEGGGDKNIDPLISAKRELLEETGIIAAEWKLISEIHTSNSVTDEVGYIYLAKQLSFHEPDPDEDEDITIKKIPFHEAYSMLEKGEIKDSLTVVALLKAKIILQL
ncbi:MAG: NUDIX hydrolase [Fimbriimonadaceae bacterium]|nr:NUDIX hydrolase [Chitinophagales bacterium]